MAQHLRCCVGQLSQCNPRKINVRNHELGSVGAAAGGDKDGHNNAEVRLRGLRSEEEEEAEQGDNDARHYIQRSKDFLQSITNLSEHVHFLCKKKILHLLSPLSSIFYKHL